MDEIFSEGNVGRDGRLCPGDQILSVNGMDCTHVALSQVNLALSAPSPVTTITVLREVQDEGEWVVRVGGEGGGGMVGWGGMGVGW